MAIARCAALVTLVEIVEKGEAGGALSVAVSVLLFFFADFLLLAPDDDFLRLPCVAVEAAGALFARYTITVEPQTEVRSEQQCSAQVR
jgi:hypothetical protein